MTIPKQDEITPRHDAASGKTQYEVAGLFYDSRAEAEAAHLNQPAPTDREVVQERHHDAIPVPHRSGMWWDIVLRDGTVIGKGLTALLAYADARSKLAQTEEPRIGDSFDCAINDASTNPSWGKGDKVSDWPTVPSPPQTEEPNPARCICGHSPGQHLAKGSACVECECSKFQYPPPPRVECACAGMCPHFNTHTHNKCFNSSEPLTCVTKEADLKAAPAIRRCPPPGCVFGDDEECLNCANTDRKYAAPEEPAIVATGMLDSKFPVTVRRDIPPDAIYAGTKSAAYLILKYPADSAAPAKEVELPESEFDEADDGFAADCLSRLTNMDCSASGLTEMLRAAYRIVSHRSRQAKAALRELREARKVIEQRNAELHERWKLLCATERESAELRERLQRATDLVRHQRNEMLEAELIDAQEFAALVADSESGQRVARLEGYDGVRRKFEAELAALRADREKAVDELQKASITSGIKRVAAHVESAIQLLTAKKEG